MFDVEYFKFWGSEFRKEWHTTHGRFLCEQSIYLRWPLSGPPCYSWPPSLQGYLADTKQRPPPPQDYRRAPGIILLQGSFLGGLFCYERDAPVSLPESGCLVIFTPHVDMSERRISFRFPHLKESRLTEATLVSVDHEGVHYHTTPILISKNRVIKWFWKVKYPAESSTYCFNQ